jgi:chromosome segregation ATPase
MEKRLDELNREWETVVADEDRLRLEVRNAFEGSRKLAEQARTTDPEIARMTNRIAQLEGELKQLKKDLDRRLSAIPGLREQRDQMRVFSMKLADLQTRKEKLRQERNRVSGLVYSLKQGKKP